MCPAISIGAVISLEIKNARFANPILIPKRSSLKDSNFEVADHHELISWPKSLLAISQIWNICHNSAETVCYVLLITSLL